MKQGEKNMSFKPNAHWIEGGVGKHIMFTALFEKLVEKYNQKLALMCGFPLLYRDHPLVVYSDFPFPFFADHTMTQYKNYDNIIFKEPYKGNSYFLKGEKHLIDSWAEMYEIEKVEKIPNFYFSSTREKELQNEILKLGKFILVQFTGGQGEISPTSYNRDNVGRNYKYGQELVNLLKEALPEINIIIFGHVNELDPLLNTFNHFQDRQDFMILAKYCVSFISIDSALQHFCSNKHFNKTGIVLWGRTSPSSFGYEKNINLKSNYPYTVEIKPQDIVDKFLSLKVEQ